MVEPLVRRSDLLNPRPQDSKSPVIELVAYEISHEPVADDYAAWGLNAQDWERISRVSQQLHDQNPATLISELKSLINQFPRCPKLLNHLAVAYQAAKRTEDADRMVEETYRRFPDYLFGIVNYCHLRIRQGHPEEVRAILKDDFALHRWLPGREIYHVSEAVSFFGLLVIYFLAIDEPKQAAGYLDMLEQIHPEHPITSMARSKMLLCLSDVMLGDD